MSDSDPFDLFRDDDKTILRPSPGGRRRRTSLMPQAAAQAPARSSADVQGDFLAGDNPFITDAFALLSLVPKIRNLPFHPAVNELRDQLVGEIRTFEQKAHNQRVMPEVAKIASYFLCTLIDETVLNTPWGNQSTWGQQSLLIQFHREARGGERFFEILDRLKRQPAENLNLLELAYMCLTLGFEGKYQLVDRGLRDLDQLRQELYVLIQRTKDTTEQPLSSHWHGLRDRHTPIARHVPIWIGIVVAGAVLMLLYMGFAYAINSSSNHTYRQLAEAAREQIQTPPVAPHPQRPATTARPPKPVVAPIRTIRWEPLLSGEIARGLVEIVDGNILRISNAFPSGSDRIKQAYVPMLKKIARELESGKHLIEVLGYTDDRPIFSARFPSNWDLSEARAKNVADILLSAARLKGRVRYEGRADNDPIAPNDTAANRARNRRIDIRIR
jgi:type VI secretion system protein ImpK